MTKDAFQGYYTHSPAIVRYMLDMADLKPGQRVLEPCAGDGAFLDALLHHPADVSIDACELAPDALQTLQTRYAGHPRVTLAGGDALTGGWLDRRVTVAGPYQRVIANPPYGAWQKPSRREALKQRYPGLYVKETYSLFLYRCLQLLAEGGVLVFITPDTYLNLHRHTRLRNYLLTHSRIREITLFPSSFFPGVNFGYSRLSIITLEKAAHEGNDQPSSFRVVTGLGDPAELGSRQTHHQIYTFAQADVYNNVDHALFVSDNPRVTRLINRDGPRVGDIADCVTGFYSGDDRKHLRALSADQRPACPYAQVEQDRICWDFLDRKGILDGIDDRRSFIPIVKGGGVGYYKADRWFMDWSVEAVSSYRSSRKARFQNQRYYFRYGIGIPMVSSSKLTAALIENRLFDQSIVGVFPRDPAWLFYLLAFFNSPTATRLIRTINPTANNSANYIKKLPFIPPPPDVLPEIDRLVREIVEGLKRGELDVRAEEDKLHAHIAKIYEV